MPNRRVNPKPITIVLSVSLLLIALMNLTSCKEEEETYQHTITLDGNVANASAYAWNDGEVLKSQTTDANGDAQLQFINQEPETTLDSITLKADGYNTAKVTNVKVGNEKTLKLTLEEIEKAQNEFWAAGEFNGKNVAGYQEGAELIVWNGETGPYKTNILKSELQNMTLDSMVFTGTDKQIRQVKTGVALQPGGNTINVTLEDKAEPNEFSIKGTTNVPTNMNVAVWYQGNRILEANSNGETNYKTNTLESLENSITSDSIVFKADKYKNLVMINYILKPGENVINAELEKITIMLTGTTINITNSNEPPYVIDANFINKRKEANMTFEIFNAEGNFEKTITSDANAQFSTELPDKGYYGIIIRMADQHPMMYRITIDSLNNTELIAGVGNVLSLYNFRQSHMGMKPNNDNPEVLELHKGEGRTLNWKKEIWDKGIGLLFLEREGNGITGELGNPVTEEMKELVLDNRTYMNITTNNFYSLDRTEFTDNLDKFTNEGYHTFSYQTNIPFGGVAGFTKKDGVVVRSASGINVTLFEQYKEFGNEKIKNTLLNEDSQAATGAWFELWKEDLPSNWNKSPPEFRFTFTDDSKNAMMTYFWIQNKMYQENTDAAGLYTGMWDSRMNTTEFKDLDIVKDYIQQNELKSIKDKLGF